VCSASPPANPPTARLVGDPDRPRAWTLLIGGTAQSYVDLDDPQYLEFEYMRWIGHLIDLAAPPGQPLRVLHLGGGALTLARYAAATRPGSPQLAVESDAALVDLVRRELPLAQRSRRAAGHQPGRVRVRVGDAREVLGTLPDASFDVVIADLFAGARTPAHLTTAEFTAEVARVLGPGGVHAANVGDGPPLAHARARVATVQAVFPHAALLAEPRYCAAAGSATWWWQPARGNCRPRGCAGGWPAIRCPAGWCTARSSPGSSRGPHRSPTLPRGPPRPRRPTCSPPGAATGTDPAPRQSPAPGQRRNGPAW